MLKLQISTSLVLHVGGSIYNMVLSTALCNFQVASHFLMWPIYQPVLILDAVIQCIKVEEVSGSCVCQRSLKTLNNNSILRERTLWLFAAE